MSGLPDLIPTEHRLVEHGELPCYVCGKPHGCRAWFAWSARLTPLTWDERGHRYEPLSWEQTARVLAARNDQSMVDVELDADELARLHDAR